MTEAKTSYLTPQIVICSPGQDQQTEIEQLIFQTDPATQPLQLNTINPELKNLSIEQVRELSQDLSYASYGGKLRQVLILAADTAGHEAQNALLKLLEEPPAKTQIWLGVSQVNKLLPTVRSRCLEKKAKLSQSGTQIGNEAVNLASQLPFLSHRALVDAAEKHKDRQAAKELINQLILYFHAQLENNPSAALAQSINQLLQTQMYLEANVNVRLALEDCFFGLKAQLSSSNIH
ncbi:MAG: hypothetical protein COU66_03175 [Candidatus Pacebacteria bacterium CG10_big_fil_rev_8_21_14_0_10_44_11]|nr:MAG: hypothetical protein COU66_03175 [Candidatus Pacebacteria bacterium CG10_big_fil_rev_8_21_14_0_10_44_11]